MCSVTVNYFVPVPWGGEIADYWLFSGRTGLGISVNSLQVLSSTGSVFLPGLAHKDK
jgi:hypothetical protein